VVESCVIITTDANNALRPLHDRIPVILPDDECDRWLDPKCNDSSKLGELLKPYPSEEMAAFPVSTLVNSPRNESPGRIDPVAAR
jgi:putative SOS response-associated peptidase YedK